MGGREREVEEPAADVATGGEEEVAAAAGGRVEEHLGRADGAAQNKPADAFGERRIWNLARWLGRWVCIV